MVTEITDERMGEKVKIEPGMRVEIRTKDGEIHLGTISNIEKEPKVTPYAFSWEEVEERGWEARRWEVAVAATQGILSNQKLYDEIVEQWSDDEDLPCWEAVAHESLMFAHALVDAFKKEERCCK